MLHLSDHLKASLGKGEARSVFDAVMKLDGVVYRKHKNRRTVLCDVGGRPYFVKVHGPTGWREILKHALRGRWPILTAETEWRAIRRLEVLGVPTVHAAGWGVRGRWPERLESFIITEALGGGDRMTHLHELTPQLRLLDSRSRALVLRQLIRETAHIARLLHTNGLAHRDFYLAHFMVNDRDWRQWRSGDDLKVYLIDLHRMQIRRCADRRSTIKDIAALLFSAFDVELSDRDYLRFLSTYWGRPWRERWPQTKRWRRQVVRRAIRLYRAEHGKSPRLPAGLSNFA